MQNPMEDTGFFAGAGRVDVVQSQSWNDIADPTDVTLGPLRYFARVKGVAANGSVAAILNSRQLLPVSFPTKNLPHLIPIPLSPCLKKVLRLLLLRKKQRRLQYPAISGTMHRSRNETLTNSY